MNSWKEIFHACVDEMYPMNKGVLILRADEVILECGDGYMTRKQVKHIIEIPNKNHHYPGSILRVKVFKGWERGVVVAMDVPTKEKRAVITAYPYHAISAYFLLLKKLRAAAAGEAPYPKVIPEG